MNLRYIEVVHALLRASSVTEAAQSLNISQPAVSIMLKRAESQLGFPLFRRVSGRLHPTPEALALKEEIDGVFSRIERLRRVAGGLRDGVSGSFSLAASPSLASGYLPDVVAGFQRDRPGVSIDIQSLPSPRVVDLVSRREVDLGVCYHVPPDVGTSVEVIGCAQIACIVPAGHPLSGKAAIGPADLAGQRIVTYAARSPFGRLIRAVFAQAGVPLQIPIEIHNAAEATFLVMADAGVALIDPILSESYTLPSIAVKPFRPEISLPLQLVLPKDREPSRLVAKFADRLRTWRKRRPSAGDEDQSTCSTQALR